MLPNHKSLQKPLISLLPHQPVASHHPLAEPIQTSNPSLPIGPQKTPSSKPKSCHGGPSHQTNPKNNLTITKKKITKAKQNVAPAPIIDAEFCAREGRKQTYPLREKWVGEGVSSKASKHTTANAETTVNVCVGRRSRCCEKDRCKNSNRWVDVVQFISPPGDVMPRRIAGRVNAF